MPLPSHPLQDALDRATAATFTVVDLIDIARERKPTAANGRAGRTDARQGSLYKAVIAASVAAIEETFEAMTVAGLHGLGIPAPALDQISVAVGRAMQSPNPQNLDNLLDGYLSFKPSDHWSAHLGFSQPAYRQVKLSDPTLDYRYVHTVYARSKTFSGQMLSGVLARFVRIRNSFAHQDTSTAIFTKSQRSVLSDLRLRKSNTPEEKELVEAISATCAITLDRNAPPLADPVVRWTIHETHAVNALRLYVGLVVSACDALADHLESTAHVQISQHKRLRLRVQDGRWHELDDPSHTYSSTNVDFELIPYKPSLR